MKNEQVMANEERQEAKKTFCIGDSVIYRAEGICDVVDVRREVFAGRVEAVDYYSLSPRNDPNSTIYVPVDNEALTSLMRPLPTQEQIVSLCEELRNARMDWIAESRARNTKFREILSLGDCREVIVLVNTVRERIAENERIGKKSGTTDTGALRRGAKLLRDAFSAAMSIRSDEELFALLDGN